MLVAFIIVLLFLSFKFGYIVLDRKVFRFQVSHILKRGRINNIREYRVIHNYIEMLFENDPDSFEVNPSLPLLNKMMNDFGGTNT
ncbi:hypothetical protein A3Q34_08530 [Colwellia sp. PAMC 20917]|jgi:hypothetical protein|nr:hypothetical protein A3Q34_08530 [Colwellia sp. PAMC 20917]MBA6339300.1 hypothetical protein [Colwellia sp. BRX8-7]MBA6381327.1 hypothetical protein [Colwellia sp. BRX10-7]MBA6389074.1 hypothetical protein [Colwellia sp. BRX10-2]MBA6403795.1 hypothetical protein [Colwellia sp. BRX10-5]MBA6407677.1 hypothetical protein [Colwellia sp. BRX10-1]